MTEGGSQPDTSWDEAQIIAALAHLERLQAQVNELRPTIPRLLAPFHAPISTALFHDFKAGIDKSAREIKNFQQNYREPDTQKVFRYARERAAADSDLSRSVDVPQNGWIERERRAKEDVKKSTTTAIELQAALSDDEVEKIVREWKERHPNLTIKEKAGFRDMTISFVSSGQFLTFHITVSSDANDAQKLRAECVGSKEPQPTITRCMASRPKANDLKYLLDMVAAYKSVKSDTCAKCGECFDADTSRPLARRIKPAAQGGEATEAVWEARHEGCLN